MTTESFRAPSKVSKKPRLCIDGTNHSQIFSKVIDGISCENFLTNYWEQNYLLVKRTKEATRSTLFSFSLDTLWSIISNSKLDYEKHVNIYDVIDGINQNTYKQNKEKITVENLNECWQKGRTIQFLHPQCYQDDLYHLLFALEEEFECLWGANAYLTPEKSQGLAPHFDDSEVFVIQTEGKKVWKIYENTDQNEKLCLVSSLPLPKERVGKLLAEFTLEPGDLLYLPRGTIHCAETVPGVHSVHVTISTYQRHCYSEVSAPILEELWHSFAETSKALRTGLPFKICSKRNVEKINKISQSITDGLIDFKNFLEENSVTKRMVKKGIDCIAEDFILSRLPPPHDTNIYSDFIDSLPKSAVKVGDTVELSKPSWFNFTVLQEPSDTTGILRISSCLENNRDHHMGLAAQSEEMDEQEVSSATADIDQACLGFLESLLSNENTGKATIDTTTIGFASLLNTFNALKLA